MTKTMITEMDEMCRVAGVMDEGVSKNRVESIAQAMVNNPQAQRLMQQMLRGVALAPAAEMGAKPGGDVFATLYANIQAAVYPVLVDELMKAGVSVSGGSQAVRALRQMGKEAGV